MYERARESGQVASQTMACHSVRGPWSRHQDAYHPNGTTPNEKAPRQRRRGSDSINIGGVRISFCQGGRMS